MIKITIYYCVYNLKLLYSFFKITSLKMQKNILNRWIIIAITIIVALTIPNLRYFFYFFGFLIALSRVVVGAHFVTDVVAGALIAIMFYKIFSFTKFTN